MDYRDEIERIEKLVYHKKEAYSNLIGRLVAERDVARDQRDSLQHQIDHPVMTDEVDELAKLAWETERHHLVRDDETIWEDLDGWTAYGYYLMAEAVRDAVTRKLGRI